MVYNDYTFGVVNGVIAGNLLSTGLINGAKEPGEEVLFILICEGSVLILAGSNADLPESCPAQ